MESPASASLADLVAIGHRTGLFETMAEMPPSTCEHIADAAGLTDEYVGDWLVGMAAGRVVEYDPALATYFLPRDRVALLARPVVRQPDLRKRLAITDENR
jgi:hypothetical protein